MGAAKGGSKTVRRQVHRGPHSRQRSRTTRLYFAGRFHNADHINSSTHDLHHNQATPKNSELFLQLLMLKEPICMRTWTRSLLCCWKVIWSTTWSKRTPKNMVPVSIQRKVERRSYCMWNCLRPSKRMYQKCIAMVHVVHVNAGEDGIPGHAHQALYQCPQ